METSTNSINEKLFFKIVRNKVIWNYILNFIKNQSLDSMKRKMINIRSDYSERIPYSKLIDLPMVLYENKKNWPIIKDILKSNKYVVFKDCQTINLLNLINKLKYDCENDIEIFYILYNNYFKKFANTDKIILKILTDPNNNFIKSVYKELGLNDDNGENLDSQTHKKEKKIIDFLKYYRLSISFLEFIHLNSEFIQNEILFFIKSFDFLNAIDATHYTSSGIKSYYFSSNYLNFKGLKEFSIKQLLTFSNQFKKFYPPSSLPNDPSMMNDEKQLYKYLIENYQVYFYLIYLKKYKNQFFLPWNILYEPIIIVYTFKTLSVVGLQYLFDNIKDYKIRVNCSNFFDFNGKSNKRIFKFLKLYYSSENKFFTINSLIEYFSFLYCKLTLDQIKVLLYEYRGFLYTDYGLGDHGNYLFMEKPSLLLNLRGDDNEEAWLKYKWYLENILFKNIVSENYPIYKFKSKSFNEITWIFKNKEMIDWVVLNSEFYFPVSGSDFSTPGPLNFLNFELANYFKSKFTNSKYYTDMCMGEKSFKLNFIFSNLYQESIENCDIEMLKQIDSSLNSPKFNSDGFKYFKFKNFNLFLNLINYLIETSFKGWESDMFFFFTFNLIPFSFSMKEIKQLFSMCTLMDEFINNGFKLFSKEIISWWLELICNFNLLSNKHYHQMIEIIISKLILTSTENVKIIQEIINSNLNYIIKKHVKETNYYLNKFQGHSGIDEYEQFNSNITNVINVLIDQLKYLFSFKEIKFPVFLYQHLYKILLKIDGISLYEIEEINKLYIENGINNPVEPYHILNWLNLKSTKFTKFINIQYDEFYLADKSLYNAICVKIEYLDYINWSNEAMVDHLNLKFQDLSNILSFDQIHSTIYFKELFLILKSRKPINRCFFDLKMEFDLELDFLFSVGEIQLFFEQIENNPFKNLNLNYNQIILLFNSFINFIFKIDHLKQFIKLILNTFNSTGKEIIKFNFNELILKNEKLKNRDDIISIFLKYFEKN